jgi:hypothetical protein
VDGKAEPGVVPGAGDNLPNDGISHRTSALGREDVRRSCVLAPKSSQRSYLRPAERMSRWHSVLNPRDVQ